MSVIHINGIEIGSNAESAMALMVLAKKITERGGVELITLEGTMNGDPSKTLLLLSAGTHLHVTIPLDELPDDTLGSTDVAALLKKYTDRDPSHEVSDAVK